LLETLAQKVQPRALVDKSSIITYRPECMRRAIRMFPKARFIHLVRHPRGSGESVTKYLAELRRLRPVPPHWLLHLACYPQEGVQGGDMDPQRSWLALNRNICRFLESVPEDQKLRIRGEDIVSDPTGRLPEVCRWLGVRDDPAAVAQMKHPESSPYARFGPPGARFGNDRFFLEDPVLRPGKGSQGARPEKARDFRGRCLGGPMAASSPRKSANSHVSSNTCDALEMRTAEVYWSIRLQEVHFRNPSDGVELLKPLLRRGQCP
jgi:hypothetical protein